MPNEVQKSQISRTESHRHTGDARADGGPGPDGRAVRERAQTTLDFTAGISIFLLAVLTMFIFASGSVGSFTEGNQDDIAVANRIADDLAEGRLGDPATPRVLNATCTVEFFEGNSPSYCRFTGSSLTERLGVMDQTNLNITVRGDVRGPDGRDIVCWNDDSDPGHLIEADEAGCDTLFTIGPESPDRSGSTVTSQRVVTINGQDVTMIIEVW